MITFKEGVKKRKIRDSNEENGMQNKSFVFFNFQCSEVLE